MEEKEEEEEDVEEEEEEEEEEDVEEEEEAEEEEVNISRMASACNTDTTPTQPHRNSNTHRTKNNTTNVVIQQNSRKLLMMYILMSEKCWAHKKWNKIASDIKLVFYSSINVSLCHLTWTYPGTNTDLRDWRLVTKFSSPEKANLSIKFNKQHLGIRFYLRESPQFLQYKDQTFDSL